MVAANIGKARQMS